MAVTVLCRSALVAGMRELDPSEGFLPLPKVDLLLYKAPGTTSPAANALHDYLAHYLGLTSVERNRTPAPSAPNPKFAHTERQMRPRTSGSSGVSAAIEGG